MESRDEYTFYGAMHSLCTSLINKYPKAEVIFMTPLHQLSEDDEVKEMGIKREVTLLGYVNIIKEMAGYYGLTVLDLFNTSGLQPKVEIIRKIYMPDGLHPSDAGAEKIAKYYDWESVFRGSLRRNLFEIINLLLIR